MFEDLHISIGGSHRGFLHERDEKGSTCDVLCTTFAAGPQPIIAKPRILGTGSQKHGQLQ